jgi:hypothetical protein
MDRHLSPSEWAEPVNRGAHPEELPGEVLYDVASVLGAEAAVLSGLPGGVNGGAMRVQVAGRGNAVLKAVPRAHPDHLDETLRAQRVGIPAPAPPCRYASYGMVPASTMAPAPGKMPMIIIKPSVITADATSGVPCLIGADYGSTASDPRSGEIYLCGPRKDLVSSR